MKDYDTIIIGGGCSGLSLAVELAKKEPYKRILILENRFAYQHDRTWSFWDVETQPYENQIQHKWSNWQVRYKGVKLSLDSTLYRYCSIPSSCFYDQVIQEITLLPNVKLLMDCEVTSLVESSSYVTIETSKGCYKSAKVFDSRPEKSKTPLYQHFVGWHVVTKKPLFDPETVILMDFDVDQSRGLHFMYLLPFSSTEALIESTFISPHIHDDQVYEEGIRGYLKERFQTCQYQIIRKERGVLPLRATIPEKKSKKVIPIGAKAGWTRASTGYAFLPIQKAVRNLVFGQHKQKSNKLDSLLDEIFLAFLRDYPQLGPEVFFQLFDKNPPERLIRFLTGHRSFVDLLQVLFSMPKLVMIKQALKTIIKALT